MSPLLLRSTLAKTEDVGEYDGGIVLFDENIGYKEKAIVSVSIWRRHRDSNVYHMSQNYFDRPKSTIMNNINLIVSFEQPLKGVENKLWTFAGLYLSYEG